MFQANATNMKKYNLILIIFNIAFIALCYPFFCDNNSCSGNVGTLLSLILFLPSILVSLGTLTFMLIKKEKMLSILSLLSLLYILTSIFYEPLNSYLSAGFDPDRAEIGEYLTFKDSFLVAYLGLLRFVIPANILIIYLLKTISQKSNGFTKRKSV